MLEIKVQELTKENFEKYGSFCNLINPVDAICGGTGHPVAFYRDMMPVHVPGPSLPSFSICRVEEREMIIKVGEYHSYATEANIPLEADCITYVAVAGKGPCPVEKWEAFRVPKGTLVTYRPGVWHCAPFPYDTDVVNVVVFLPERTYANDCVFDHFEEDRWVKIVK
jgi:ureidoglycolate lyase